ncbi:bifunctional transcriptional activator/DNA repair enzyme AdaA [Clostridium puniceum]|uniref:Bifunctional transcriptional activator/DNA repair enzyme AdaA n=1 Tax=Clostridium puniceum TaxID=29367 RepID=A0A1S8TF73_9CLOT|nr:AraC family transcriptional regulator [Clostridium puniceum]OOM76055.1 bifunctional transcriptional activator/DNA repair enzyme AdaA [Clostridium puniceum]
MIDMYTISGMIQSILTNSYLNNGKKKNFEDAVIELYEKKNYVTIKPSLPEESFWNCLSDDEFLDLLNNIPICINTILENGSIVKSSELKESIILREQSDIFVNKHFNYINDQTHSHDYFEIYYVFKGNCEFQFEKEHRTLEEGELCIIAPTSSHNIIADDKDSIIISIAIRKSTFDSTFFTLLSQKDLLSYFFKTMLYNKTTPNYLLFHTKNSKDIKIIIKNLIMENNKNDMYYNTCSISWANILFSTILRNYSETIQFNSYDMGSDFSLIVQYIQNNYKTLTLNSLAEYFHYSESHLSILIKKNLSLKFTTLITKLKMEDAKNYVINTDLPIEKISESVGYNSVEHFSRMFKRYYKKSPQQYRKSQ